MLFHQDYILKATFLNDAMLGTKVKLMVMTDMGPMTAVGSLRNLTKNPKHDMQIASFSINGMKYEPSTDGTFINFSYCGRGRIETRNGWNLFGLIYENKLKWSNENIGAVVTCNKQSYCITHLGDFGVFFLGNGRSFSLNYQRGLLELSEQSEHTKKHFSPPNI